MGYILAVHVPIAGATLLPPLFGLPMVLTPVHIALLEMLIDPACSIVFEAEREEPDLMRRPPRPANAQLLSRPTVMSALIQGALSLAVVVFAIFLGRYRGMPADETRALAFVILVLTNVGLILTNVSGATDGPGRWANVPLRIVLAGVATVLAVALFWPPASDLLQLGPLHWDDFAICGAVGAATFVLLGVVKRLFGERRAQPIVARR